jgi:hypothetical protein
LLNSFKVSHSFDSYFFVQLLEENYVFGLFAFTGVSLQSAWFVTFRGTGHLSLG